MRSPALALGLLGAAACGARRAPPEPAFAAPLTARTAVVDDGIDIAVEVGCRVHLDRVEWSTIGTNGTVTDQPVVLLDLQIQRGSHLLTLPWGKEPVPERVQGTVHGRCALGPAVRYPFSLPTPAAPLAPLDVLP